VLYIDLPIVGKVWILLKAIALISSSGNISMDTARKTVYIRYTDMGSNMAHCVYTAHGLKELTCIINIANGYSAQIWDQGQSQSIIFSENFAWWVHHTKLCKRSIKSLKTFTFIFLINYCRYQVFGNNLAWMQIVSSRNDDMCTMEYTTSQSLFALFLGKWDICPADLFCGSPSFIG
jgi:hypothetical protein